MTFDNEVAAVIRRRLDVVQILDDSAELSFMESARFRLELLRIVQRFDDGVTSTNEALTALECLYQRINAVVSAPVPAHAST